MANGQTNGEGVVVGVVDAVAEPIDATMIADDNSEVDAATYQRIVIHNELKQMWVL